MSKINDLNMSTIEVMVALAEGNPGAITVMKQMLEEGAQIDPDSALGSLGAILSLDAHEIYGSRIWILHKDVCGSDITKTLGALRAVQLGLRSHMDLSAAIDSRGAGFDADAALAAVLQRLPRFGQHRSEA